MCLRISAEVSKYLVYLEFPLGNEKGSDVYCS